ncbi:MAG: peptidylprolyl isomerase [Verrucomicrobiaceae bacterium]|nr:peptidylprolyl isomerase [Verrucomicrobiaceae bacterium]
MKGCLEVIVVLLLGAGLAAWIVWDALHLPEPPHTTVNAASADPAAVKAELAMLKRQFQTPADYQQRLAGQGLTEAALQNRIATALSRQQEVETTNQPNVTEKEVRAWFDAHRESLRIPETFHAVHIFLTRHEKSKPDRETEIRFIQRQILNGSLNFREAAAKFSEDDRTKKLAGDLGWFSADRMPPDFIAAVKALKPGQTSSPVLTELGWHLIQLMERRPSRLPTFEEARTEIQATLETKARQAIQRSSSPE